MIKTILFLLLVTVILNQSNVVPLLAVSNNPNIGKIIGFDNLIATIKSSETKYVYFDISPKSFFLDHKPVLQNITNKSKPNFVKHISMIRSKQQQILNNNIINFSNNNTYTLENITNIKNQTSKVIINQNLLNLDLFKMIDPSCLIILNFKQEEKKSLFKEQDNEKEKIND